MYHYQEVLVHPGKRKICTSVQQQSPIPFDSETVEVGNFVLVRGEVKSKAHKVAIKYWPALVKEVLHKGKVLAVWLNQERNVYYYYFNSYYYYYYYYYYIY